MHTGMCHTSSSISNILRKYPKLFWGSCLKENVYINVLINHFLLFYFFVGGSISEKEKAKTSQIESKSNKSTHNGFNQDINFAPFSCYFVFCSCY